MRSVCQVSVRVEYKHQFTRTGILLAQVLRGWAEFVLSKYLGSQEAG